MGLRSMRFQIQALRHVASPTSPQQYVTGGSELKDDADNIAEYNAHLLNVEGQGNCSASVISNRWLLTAAHCSVIAGETIARIGRRNSTEAYYRVKKFVAHPHFLNWDNSTSGGVLNDIALVQLDTAIAAPHIMRLNSNKKGPISGTIVRISGYGMTSTIKRAQNMSSKALGFVDVPVINGTECMRMFRQADAPKLTAGIREHSHICIGRDKVCPTGGICYGDSGSGLFARNSDGTLVQVGIASYSTQKCASDAPDVFARVSNYIQWIGNVTGDDVVQVSPWSAPETHHATNSNNNIRSYSIIIAAFAAASIAFVLAIRCIVRHRARRKLEIINDPTGLTNNKI